MSSAVDICNLALVILGADEIRSFEEDNKRARICKRLFPKMRDSVMSQHDWSFARQYTKLQPLDPSTVLVPDGVTAYAVPSDCLAMRDMYPRGTRDKWWIHGNIFFTIREPDIYVYYTRSVTDTEAFNEAYIDLLSSKLAVKMAPAITQDKQLSAQLIKQYEQDKFDCWEADSNIGNYYREPDEEPRLDTFVNPDSILASQLNFID